MLSGTEVLSASLCWTRSKLMLLRRAHQTPRRAAGSSQQLRTTSFQEGQHRLFHQLLHECLAVHDHDPSRVNLMCSLMHEQLRHIHLKYRAGLLDNPGRILLGLPDSMLL